MKTEAQEVNRYFEEMRVRLETVDQVKREVDRLIAPDFNPFALLWPDEVRLSNVIAALLNPEADHGQAAKFLDAFIRLLEGVNKAQPDQPLAKVKQAWGQYSDIKVRIEQRTSLITNSLRRMDILVRNDQCGIMIENKPWAWDQPGQLAAYNEHLSKKFPQGYVMVYLSGDGSPPSGESLPKQLSNDLQNQGKLIVISYRPDLENWLNRCIEIASAERVRVILADLLNWIKATPAFVMNVQMTKRRISYEQSVS